MLPAHAAGNTSPAQKQISEGKLSTHQSTKASDKRALTHAYSYLSDDELDQFTLGKSFFNIPWVEAPSATTARDGLGPLFNANTCISCHPGNGAGFASEKKGIIHRSLVFRISQQVALEGFWQSGFKPDPVYGAQLSINGVHGVPFEGTPKVTYSTHDIHYPDGEKVSLRTPHYTFENLNYGPFDKTTIIAPRVALSLVGLGQIEKIPALQIIANEDPEDRDKNGISGKANRVCSLESKDPALCNYLGRFTWKASAPTVKHQVAVAMHNDMGLTTPLIAHENCTATQSECLQAPKGRDIDVPMYRLDAVSFYISHLKIPAQRNPDKHIEGAQHFNQVGCSGCHVTSFVTNENNVIHPFSDFLLHDMGEALSDNRSEFSAQPREWRTPPLWGLGLSKTITKHATYLHDGRAQSIEEAILWHSGEAETIIQRYKQLPRSERQNLINFLRSI